MCVIGEVITIITDKGVNEITEEYEQFNIEIKSTNEFSSLVVVKAYESEKIFFGDCEGFIYNSMMK